MAFYFDYSCSGYINGFYYIKNKYSGVESRHTGWQGETIGERPMRLPMERRDTPCDKSGN